MTGVVGNAFSRKSVTGEKGVRQWSCRMKNAQSVAIQSNKMIFLRQLLPTEDNIGQVKNVIIGPALRALQ
jgi:hypothetical protein